jgi:hypothetical protein
MLACSAYGLAFFVKRAFDHENEENNANCTLGDGVSGRLGRHLLSGLSSLAVVLGRDG